MFLRYMRLAIVFVAVSAVSLAWVDATWGQTPGENSLELLEARVKALEAELDARDAETETSLGNEILKFQSKYPITFTGFLKADMSYHTARVNSTDAPRWAMPEPPGVERDDDFGATIQHSRFIVKWSGPEVVDGKLDAHWEMDLFTLGDTGDAKFNNSQLRVRQLFMKLSYPAWSFLAGQAWDLFSPLAPGTLNTNGYYWFGGNAGFRRPQMRLSAWTEPSDGYKFSADVSINANIGRTRLVDGNGNARTINSGEDAGFPVFEGRLEYSFPLTETGAALVGASGVWGMEVLDGVDSEIEQYGYGLHLKVPLMEQLTVMGEIQTGKNTDAFLMGSGFSSTGRAIEATSGWAQLQLQPYEDLTANLFYGRERIKSGDVSTGARKRNNVMGGNLKYALMTDLTLGAEYTFFDTDYKESDNADASQFWLSLIFRF